MAFSCIMKSFTAVVCFVLLQCARSVPIQKQSKSAIAGVKINKRSAETVEFLMDSNSHASLSDQTNSLAQIAQSSQQAFNNDLTCPQSVSTGENDPIHKRSSCPWYYVDSHEPTRFPATILTAESLCTYAIKSSNTLECSPVTQTITVLRQQEDKSNGNYVWLEETQTVVIGFTATGRRIAETQTTSAPSDVTTPDFARK